MNISAVVELRQYKNDSIQLKKLFVLKSSRLFTQSVGDGKRGNFKTGNFFD